MECCEALTLLSGHIDKQNTPQEEAALRAHLATCENCRALLRAYEDIDRNVAALEVPAPDTLAPAVMEQIAKQEKKKHRAPWLGVLASAGIVAAVLVMLVGTKTLSLPKLSDVKIDEGALMKPEKARPTHPPAQPIPRMTEAPMPEASEENVTEAAYTEAPVPTVAAETEPEKKGFHTRNGGIPLPCVCAPVTPEADGTCKALAEQNTAPVLLFSGIDNDFFATLEQPAPKLFSNLTANSEILTDEKTGGEIVTCDYTTAAAFCEYLMLLLNDEMEATVEADLVDDLRLQYEQYGFDVSHLQKLCPDGIDAAAVTLPGNWPEDFLQQWVTGQNWKLIYPEEGFAPGEDDLAYLFLLPPIVEP